MRAGGYTVHQSLTAEAAAVLKLALGLARRRGHAQATPLHVAFTMLGSSASSSCPLPAFAAPVAAAASSPSSSCCAYGLLRRACVKASHPSAAQCRALELCFNVALNRLPTAHAPAVVSPLSSPSSSSSAGSSGAPSFVAASLVQQQQQPHPTLSNALVAALKRAQANQRRGCVELQSQLPPPSSQQQQQQPLLTIKVELDQLILSILDDPSVSRVMREAGFSSAAVKANLEEESAMLLGGLGHHHVPSTPLSAFAPPQQQFLLEPYAGGPFRPAQHMNSHPGVEHSEKDVAAILEVMSRKQGKRANPVVVADSVSAAEASVAALLRRLERGDVPSELRGAHVLRLHLSHARVRLMTRADADAWVADLRRTVAAGSNARAAGLVIYIGDIRWAITDDSDGLAQVTGFSPAEQLADELARVLAAPAPRGGRVWLVAAASHQSYVRCLQQRRRALDATWQLQPVAVPSGAGAGLGHGLALGPLAARSAADHKIMELSPSPLPNSSHKEDDGVPVMCADCAGNYETEASAVRTKAEGTNLALAYFPGWPQADEPPTSHKDELVELKRRWSRSCQQRGHLQCNQPTRRSDATSTSNPGFCFGFETPTASKIGHTEVTTTLSLVLFPDSAEASNEVRRHGSNEDLLDGTTSGLQPWLDELPSGDLKRKADWGQPRDECKRWKASGGLDLNLCAHEEEEEEDGGCGSGGAPVPSDLTNDGESRGSGYDASDIRS